MTKVTGIRIHRGPFTLSSRVSEQQTSHELGQRLWKLRKTQYILAGCQNLPLLQERILDYAFDNFFLFGKAILFAGFWRLDKYTAFTIPVRVNSPDDQEISPPSHRQIGRYVSIGKPPSFPDQAELIQKAVATKDLVQAGSEKEEFLAVPLVSRDRSRVFGVLLLTNRPSNGREKFTQIDVRIARGLGEVVSKAIAQLLAGQTAG